MFRGCLTSATSVTSEGAQGIFSKITFLKSVNSTEKDEVCHSFLVKIFTKSLHRGGVLQQHEPKRLGFVIYLGLHMHQFQKYCLLRPKKVVK
jgi:hypothetical protein